MGEVLRVAARRRLSRFSRMGVIVLVSVAFMAAFVGNSSATSRASRPASSNTTPIRVTLITPLTGPYASLGASERWGAEAGVAYANSHGGALGRKFSLTVLDDAGNPTEAAADAKRLVGEHVVAILGSDLSADVLAEMPSVNQSHTPVFTAATDNSIFNVAKNPWAFPSESTVNSTNLTFVDYFVKVRHITKVGILYQTGDYGQSSEQAVIADLHKDGIRPVGTQSFVSGVSSVSAQLQALESDGAKALFVFTFGPPLVTALQDMQEIGWSPPTVTTPSVAQKATREAVGDAALRNVYGGPVGKGITVPKYGDRASALAKTFFKDVEEAEGVKSLVGEQVAASYNFDGMILLQWAIKHGKSTSGSSIRTALQSGTKIQGVQGTFTFSKTSHEIGLAQADQIMINASNACAPACVAAPN